MERARDRCQVCGVKIRESDVPLFVDNKLSGTIWPTFPQWVLVGIQFPEVGSLSILACPKCSLLGLDAVYDLYKERIKLGWDVNYH